MVIRDSRHNTYNAAKDSISRKSERKVKWLRQVDNGYANVPIEFISIDCGGTKNYTDLNTGLRWISDTGIIGYGDSVGVENSEATLPQCRRRRDFPIDDNKYCYTLSTEERRRYLVRTTFLYGNSKNTYPKFQLYLDATKWSTVTITNASEVHVKEMVIRAPSNSIDVCLCQATTGSPFISTLELRPLNHSMYATEFEVEFYLKVAARVNFGAASNEAIRYPDDPYDRIWSSDSERRQNFLVGVAPGTERINTTKYIGANTREYPPVKVMQTAVVGTKGNLTYRLNLEDFPANARAYAYFAEIEELGTSESRKFRIVQPKIPDYNYAVVNIAENANGSYTLYEPSFINATLQFVLSFSFVKTPDSTHGPLLNAIEISKYVPIAKKTDVQDVNILNSLRAKSMDSNRRDEDRGDPCVPTTWEWVACSTSIPPRITKIFRLIVRVKDDSGQTSFTLFNKEAEELIGLPVEKILNELSEDKYLTAIPPVVKNILGKKCAFDIKINAYNTQRGYEEYSVHRLSQCAEVSRQPGGGKRRAVPRKGKKLLNECPDSIRRDAERNKLTLYFILFC